MGVEVTSCPNQETEVTSTPTRPVENVVITMKGLQDRNNLLLDGSKVESKGKLILNAVDFNNVLTYKIFYDYEKNSLVKSIFPEENSREDKDLKLNL